jgi:HAD superfamily hydrolase (TIGR01509 family)
MIKALIFDCFGVFYADPVFAYMRDSATPPKKAEALHALDKQAARGELSKSGFIEQAAELLGRSTDEIDQQFFQGHDRNQELIDFAQQARKRYKVGLLSNIGGDMMDGFFTPTERQKLFDSVILSGDVKMAKPDKAIFELMMNKLGASASEIIFIDDSENHIQGAEKIGIESIQFVSNKQLRRELEKLGIEWPVENPS